jgi:predicted membrane channel-forming protein YqfA (hemolysin III family)
VTTAHPILIRRLRLAGFLVALGLIVEAITLLWSHPTAFLVFLFGGGLLVAAGVVLYLVSIATYPSPPTES